MKNKCLIVLGIVLSGCFAAKAQQDAMYTQYMFNMLPLNPAYAGSRDVVSMTALYRDQWRGIQGAPQTMTFSADAPVAKEKVGLGLTIANDRIGVYNTLGVTGSFAYRIRLKKSTLAFGVSGGFSQFTGNLTNVQTNTEKSANGFDNAFGENISRFMPNVGAGVYYSSDKFYVGFSLPHLLNNDLRPQAPNEIFKQAFRAQQFRHAFLMAGYVFKLSASVKLKPSIIWKFVTNAPTQVDVNCNVWLYDKFGIGLSYRSLDAPSILLEWQIDDNWRLGMAYDWSTRLTAYTYGSTELMLRYEFGYNKAKVVTPRYF